ERDKQNFGLSEASNLDQLILGEGYPYHTILDTAGSPNITPTIDNMLTPKGYIFPLKVGDSPAGIAFLQYVDNSWKIVQISSDLGFEEETRNAIAVIRQALNKEIIKKEDKVQLIYDLRLGLFGFTAKTVNVEEFVPLRKSYNLDIDKKVTFLDLNQKIKTVSENLSHKDNGTNSTSGGGGSSTQVQNSPKSLIWIYVLLFTIVVAIVFYSLVILRNKRQNR
ncbi:MAG: hypothetical protein K0R67_3308, partial [Paenibacillus sp.]|nr:hypothetical protein [Paenibacillus sp.]